MIDKNTPKTYCRDGRAPIPKKPEISYLMSRITAKNTKPELLVRKLLWGQGIRGYRLHWEKAPGRPDICFPSKKIAIFIHGCFWHSCPKCKPKLPKSHKVFWQQKLSKNVVRDKKKQLELETGGWQVIIIWECQVLTSPNIILDAVSNAMKSSKT
ncbi:MAG: very short patch repair endonuclease [Nitrospinota bacterium]|nr:very short patch repair endonuclease [Nitrospinota bacterium]